jgi:hypothetical protein
VYQIRSAATGKCVGIVGNSTADNAKVEIRTCSGAAGQNFTISTVATGYYAIKNTKSLKCLDVSGKSTAEGASIVQYTCNSSSTNQHWAITDAASGLRLTARHSGKVMEVSLGATADGTQVVQRTWNGATYQQFQLATATCTPNLACNPTNKRKTGLTSCTTGVSQCVESGNQTAGLLCGAPQSCTGNTKTPAQICNGSGLCTTPAAIPCPNGCSGNDCGAAVCGNGVVEVPEQCDNGASNTNSGACPYGAMSCTLCNTNCQNVVGTVAYCGDGSVQTPQEACDNGAANSVLGTCSPTCRTCAKATGYQPSLYDDYGWASGLYFTAVNDAALYQFKVFHDGSPYRVDLYKVNTVLQSSTVVWTTGSGFTSPSGSGYDTVSINGGTGVALTAGSSYILLKTGHEMETPSSVTPVFGGAANLGGIVVTSSYAVEDLSEWYQGTFDTSHWRDITDLQSCTQNL